MPPHVIRHPLLVAGVLAGFAAGALAPLAVASTPEPTATSRSLLGGLLGTVTQPVVELVEPLVDSTGVLPPELLPATVDTITGALTSTVDPLVAEDVASLLTVLSPAQVTQLVADPTAVEPLLGGLLTTMTALAGESAPSTDAVTLALGQLTAVLAGLTAPADQLGTLTGVLGQVATVLRRPGVAELPVVDPLVVQLEALGATLADGPLKTAISETVAAAATPGGLDATTLAALLALLAGAGAPSPPAPAAAVLPTPKAPAAKVLRARIVSVKVSTNRRSVRIRLACPTAAPARGCRVAPKVKVAGRSVRVARAATVRRGTARTFKAKVPASLARRVGRRGGRVVVKVSTAGSRSGAVSRAVRIRRTR